MVSLWAVLYGFTVMFLCGYGIGRVHGYKKYEQIEKESKIWAEEN